MKKTKIVIPALGLLLLSTAASVTGTVAWFASQATVTATGMSVTVKSDSAFLLIKAGAVEGADDAAKAAAIRTGGGAETANASTATGALLPVAHEDFTTGNIADIETVADSAYSNWYYRYSKNPANWGTNESGMTAKANVASNKFADYVLVNEFNLTLAAGSEPMNTLRVETCTITPSNSGDAAVKVLVATSTASQEFGNTGGSGSVTLQNSLTDQTTMQVKVYIYWDGNDEDVFTNGIEDLKSTAVEVKFTGLVGAAN